MSKVKVSIIVPVFKVEKYLKRCVDSLLNQTLQEIEIILVDDGSPDKCPQMCETFSLKDSRIKVIHKSNEGIGKACNSGLKIATGQFVAFCDSDDYVDSTMYETMYKYGLEYKVDAVFTGIQTVDQLGNIKPMSRYEKFEFISKREEINNFLLDMIASKPKETNDRNIQMSAKIVLYRREVITKSNIQFESEREFISEDLIWHIDILGNVSSVCMLPEIYYNYFINTTSVSHVLRDDRFDYFLKLRNETIHRAQKYGLNNEVVLRSNRMFIGYVRYYMGQIYSSNLKMRQKNDCVRRICDHKIWCDIWQNYPVTEMPFKHLLVLALIKNKFTLFLNILFRLRRV